MLASLAQIKSHVGLANPQRHTSHLFQKLTAPVKMDAIFGLGGTNTPIQDEEGS